jgi:S-adenosylmethionine:tRNA ribosyltransferase-isomerase
VRVLETLARNNFEKNSGWTDLFIYPPYNFKLVEGLLTNFHLPKSSLLMLVAAFIGYEQMMNLYNLAIAKEYRFLSYGDAMLIKHHEI